MGAYKCLQYILAGERIIKLKNLSDRAREQYRKELNAIYEILDNGKLPTDEQVEEFFTQIPVMSAIGGEVAKNTKAKIGTLIHSTCEDYLKLGEVPCWKESDDRVIYGFQGFLDYYYYLDLVRKDSERLVANIEEKYAGRIDHEFYDHDGSIVVLDLKCTKSLSVTHMLQMGAYHGALESEGLINNKTVILNINQDTGKFKTLTMDRDELQMCYKMFLSILKLCMDRDAFEESLKSSGRLKKENGYWKVQSDA